MAIKATFDESEEKFVQQMFAKSNAALNNMQTVINHANVRETTLTDLIIKSARVGLEVNATLDEIVTEKQVALQEIKDLAQNIMHPQAVIDEMKTDLYDPINTLTNKLQENSERLYLFEQTINIDQNEVIEHRLEDLEAEMEKLKIQSQNSDNDDDDNSTSTGPPPLIARDCDSSDDDDSSVDCSLFGERNTNIEDDIKTLKSQMNENSQKMDFIQDGLLQSMTFDINAIRSSVMSLKQHEDNPELEVVSQSIRKLDQDTEQQIADIWLQQSKFSNKLSKLKLAVEDSQEGSTILRKL